MKYVLKSLMLNIWLLTVGMPLSSRACKGSVLVGPDHSGVDHGWLVGCLLTRLDRRGIGMLLCIVVVALGDAAVLLSHKPGGRGT